MPIRLFFIFIYALLNLQFLSGMGIETDENPARELSQRAEVCMRDSNWIEALDCYNKMVPLYKERKGEDIILFAKAFSTAGNICQVWEQYIQALDFYILSLEAAEKGKDGDLYDR